MMLALLLSRAGVDVVVLEKHGDFLRDFRGDTIHPSTLQVIHELGLLDEFLSLPHQKLYEFQIRTVGGDMATVARFKAGSKILCPYVAFIPQWDFLNFLVSKAGARKTFNLRMRTEATRLLYDGERITGVRAGSPQGDVEVMADLVVACDGRSSLMRQRAGLPVKQSGSPIDVFWFRLSTRPDDPSQAAGGRLARGLIFVLLNRREHWQCGYVIPKGAADDIRAQGLEAFRARVAGVAPFLADRVSEIDSWDRVPLLSVVIDRLRCWWRPGLLCIGDAAHAMSPVGGIGINLAIQDAVATANRLAGPLLRRNVSTRDLRGVQRRRILPTWATQRVQLLFQNRLLGPNLRGTVDPRLPLPIRIVARSPLLQRLGGRVIGIGFLPEHVHTPEAPVREPAGAG
jgi:2-polyprenyl-6-methoxyphenol hydroxylase-like FAD-dependent oxidoreductase